MALGLGLAAPVVAQQGSDLRPYAPGTPQLGIGGTPDSPANAILPQDEDWSWLRTVPLSERSAVDRLRFVPLNADGSIYASFGFDGRFGFEYFDDATFGDQPGDDLDWHLRANLFAGVTFGDRARIFGALKFGQVEDSDFPVPPVDDDGPDLHQAFAELSFGDMFGLSVQDAFVRVGRQELHYGAGRLISIRNGPNVRNDYDGVLARIAAGGVIADAFAFRPTENDPGLWNNNTDDTRAVWGLYTTAPITTFAPNASGLLGRANLDLFYIGFDREVSPYAFQPTPLDETRHTIGARFWTSGPPTDGWNLEIEGGFQFGDADGLAGGDGDIRAGYLAGSVTYGYADTRWTPVIGVDFGINTGDDDPTDDRLGTFRAPFPPGRFFGEASPLGAGNLMGLRPGITVSPSDKLSLTARYEAFWRVETEDGIYAPPQVPIRGNAGDDRFIGQEVALLASYRLSDTATLGGSIARFETGGYLSDNGPNEDVTAASLKLDIRF
ncbi:alginate export family protein [Jannaschia aquimarina]|uniref:alginate export family protein n=1 Tax=Jannaschia aquimarina TaxID=935700 RepID=UPI00137915D4|nr:alginate export family protein [Jannaschia aquimarina]